MVGSAAVILARNAAKEAKFRRSTGELNARANAKVRLLCGER
jgi:hypothetical protein